MATKLTNYVVGNNLIIPDTQGKYLLHVSKMGNSILDVVVLPQDNITDFNQWIRADADDMFRIHLFGKERLVSKPWLICFTHKPLFESESFCFDLEVGFSNGNNKDINPSNLFWIIPEGGCEDPDKPGFFIPPMYSRHSVSKDGRIWSRRSLSYGTIRPAGNATEESNYQNTSAADCLGNIKTVGMHRLLAMAFKRTEIDPDKLTVNHTEGEKNVNSLISLEWSTYRDNNEHARIFLFDKNKHPCLVRDYIKGTIYRFKTKAAAAFYYGINHGNVTEATKEGRIIRDSLEFRDDNGEPPNWKEAYFQSKGLTTFMPEIVDMDENSRRVCVYDVANQSVTIYANQYELADALNKDTRTTVRLLAMTYKQIQNGLLVCYVDELKALKDRIINGRILYTDVNNLGKEPVTLEMLDSNQGNQAQLLTFSGLNKVREALFANEAPDFLIHRNDLITGFKYGSRFFKFLSGV